MKKIDEIIKEVMEAYPEIASKQVLMESITQGFFRLHGLIELTNQISRNPFLSYLFDDVDNVKIIPVFDLRLSYLTKGDLEFESILADNYDYLRDCLLDIRYKFVPTVSKDDYYKWVNKMFEQGNFTESGWQVVNEIIVYDDEPSLIH
ncbi:hypothetical protein ACTXGU_00130 [Niallia sp. 01092]|uniref:hypothetical protein n=1 Tax=Niallia sp. 01092 TaxID=3457759 RepID=UPI003FD32154